MGRFWLLPICCKRSHNSRLVSPHNNIREIQTNTEIEDDLAVCNTLPCRVGSTEVSLAENLVVCSCTFASQETISTLKYNHKNAGEYEWLKETKIIEPKFLAEKKASKGHDICDQIHREWKSSNECN